MTQLAAEDWIARHAYLQPLADLHVAINSVLNRVPLDAAPAPAWTSYQSDFTAGVPLLHSAAVVVDWRPAADALATVIDRLSPGVLPAPVVPAYHVVRAELGADGDAAQRAIRGLLVQEAFATHEPGLWQLLACSVLSRWLRDLRPAFDRWRDEERWLRPYCPTCGAAPAMAQLVGSDPGRLRLLSCGCCTTRWRYKRTGCPFCQKGDDHRLAGLAVEDDGRLRIDYCEACGGYLKTYVGEGSETLWLADWTSLHLDVAARARGLNRLATSLFHL